MGVLSLARDIFADSTCRVCKKKASSKCSKCDMRYCSKVSSRRWWYWSSSTHQSWQCNRTVKSPTGDRNISESALWHSRLHIGKALTGSRLIISEDLNSLQACENHWYPRRFSTAKQCHRRYSNVIYWLTFFECSLYLTFSRISIECPKETYLIVFRIK